MKRLPKGEHVKFENSKNGSINEVNKGYSRENKKEELMFHSLRKLANKWKEITES